MHRSLPTILTILSVSLVLLCPAERADAGLTSWLSSSSKSAEVGTPTWWKKHKTKATFVPGEGYQVDGVDGYFDDQGRPIKAHVAKVVKPKEGHGLLHDVKVVESVDGIKSQFGMGPDEQLAQQSYQAGQDLYRQQKFSQAAKAFDEAIKRAPDTRIEQDSMFLQGESYFFAAEYSKAIGSYDELLEKYPSSQYLDKIVRRQFEIARYWEKHHDYDPHWVTTPNLFDDTRPWFDTLGNAIKTYENIRLKDPTGPLADDAVMATANSYFLRGRYNDADYQYKLLREEYPQSDHQFEAHILGLECKLMMYQGPNYDGAPLEDAKKLVKQLKQQFAGKLTPEERERLTTTQARLNADLAERDYTIAKYYDEGEHYGSAKVYYRKLAREFPESPLGKQAIERLAVLEGKADHPTSQVAWLLDMVPENAERKAIHQIPLLEPETGVSIATRPQITGGSADGSSILR
jgi:outer membrane protein assembly factor BamD (BamD/ComL family)